MRTLRFLLSLVFWILLLPLFFEVAARAEVSSERIIGSGEVKEEKTSEIWMGMYMNGIKVGYSYSQEFSLLKDGRKYQRDYSESWMKVSRLGGNPVEIITIQESLYDEQGRPIETLMRMKMSESETRLKAEITPDKIIFRSEDKIIKELPYEEKFYLGTPPGKDYRRGGIKTRKKIQF